MNRIRTKLLILIIGISLITTVITGLFAQRVNRDVVVQETEKTLEVMAREGAEKLSLMIEMQWNQLETMAAQPVFYHGDLEAQLDYLRQERDRLGLDELAVIDARGKASYTDGTVINLIDRSHVQRALTGQKAISDVLISRITGEPFVALLVPIAGPENSPEVLYLRNDGSMINDLVQEIQTELQGTAYMVNAFGAFQAYPEDQAFVYERETLETKARKFPELQERRDFVRHAMKMASGSGSYAVGEEKFFMGYAKVPQTQFTLLAGTSSEDIMAPMARFRQTFYPMVLMILALAVVTAVILARNLSRPIQELEQLFARAADGDLTVRADFKQKDEIEKAGKSFNRMMNQINQLTYYDPVTGLPNYRVIERDFHENVKNAENDGKEKLWTLIVVAADKFGRMNEKYGYLHGNEMLRKIADRIRTTHCQGCYLYRGLSDEFLILLSEQDSVQHSLDAANAILNELHKPFLLETEEYRASFSVGVAIYPDHSKTVQELLKNAGFAKNIAKEKGGRLVQLFNPDTMDQVLSQRQLENDLVAAIDQENFFLEYQPLVSLKDGRISGTEALVRWKHPKYGHISPDDFIYLAERSGLIRRLENLVWKEACTQHLSWKKMGLTPGLLAVNVSAKHFGDSEFLKDVEHVLQETGMSESLLEIELTESAVIRDVDGSVEKLQYLQDKGIRVSIDDFGTGYSSLSYLVKLPINTLKIDRSFIMNLEYSKQNRDIASTIIAMGKSLGLSLISEGIETKEQLHFVREEGCHIGQGYYFSKPLTAKAMEQLFRDAAFEVKY